MDEMEGIPREEWPWQLLIRIPDQVTEADLRKARREVLERRHLDTSAVQRWTWKEGRCVQVTHIGPYDQVADSFRRLDEQAASMGLQTGCRGPEIYMNDPGRVAPAKLKTIIRLPVTRA